MYVCNCAGVTHRELHRHLHQSGTNLKALWAERGLCRGCGKCAREVRQVLKGYQHTTQSQVETSLSPGATVTTS